MLIKGLGRVEETVEDLKPIDLQKVIPANLLNSFIGIYWHVGKGRFIVISQLIFSLSKARI